MLSKHKLYPSISTKNTKNIVRTRMNVLAFADGKFDLIQIAELIKNISKVLSEISILKKKKLIKIVK